MKEETNKADKRLRSEGWIEIEHQIYLTKYLKSEKMTEWTTSPVVVHCGTKNQKKEELKTLEDK